MTMTGELLSHVCIYISWYYTTYRPTDRPTDEPMGLMWQVPVQVVIIGVIVSTPSSSSSLYHFYLFGRHVKSTHRKHPIIQREIMVLFFSFKWWTNFLINIHRFFASPLLSVPIFFCLNFFLAWYASNKVPEIRKERAAERWERE